MPFPVLFDHHKRNLSGPTTSWNGEKKRENYLSPFNFFVFINATHAESECQCAFVEWMWTIFCLVLASLFIVQYLFIYRSIFFIHLRTDVTHCSILYTLFCRKIFHHIFRIYWLFSFLLRRQEIIQWEWTRAEEEEEKKRRGKRRRWWWWWTEKRTELAADEIQFVCTLVMHAYQTPNFFRGVFRTSRRRWSLVTSLFFRHIWVISIKMPHAIETKKSVYEEKVKRGRSQTESRDQSEAAHSYASSLSRRWYNKCQVFRTSTTYFTIFSKRSGDFHLLQHQQYNTTERVEKNEKKKEENIPIRKPNKTLLVNGDVCVRACVRMRGAQNIAGNIQIFRLLFILYIE